jgi:hypothetical protein
MSEVLHEKAAEHHEQAAKAHRTAAAHYRDNDHVNSKLQSIQAVEKSKTADFHSVLANKKSQERK